MTREEAGAYRKELMGERTIAVQRTNSSFFEVVSPSPPLFLLPWYMIRTHHLCMTGIQHVVRGFTFADLNEVVANHRL